MTDIDSALRFSGRVDCYSQYRPAYPRQLVGLFTSELGLKPSHAIADIGSGTGISSRLFLELGCGVYGIEPNAEMRVEAERYLVDYPEFRTIDGTAEKTGLEDQSVEMITAFQSFHWFDNAKTATEFRRIIGPGGYLVLVWNERLLDANRFLLEYEQLLTEFGTDYKQIRHDRVDKNSIEALFGSSFVKRTFDNAQTLDLEGFIGRTLSASYMPSVKNPNYGEMIKNVRRLFAAHQEKGRIRVFYHTKVYYGKI